MILDILISNSDVSLFVCTIFMIALCALVGSTVYACIKLVILIIKNIRNKQKENHNKEQNYKNFDMSTCEIVELTGKGEMIADMLMVNKYNCDALRYNGHEKKVVYAIREKDTSKGNSWHSFVFNKTEYRLPIINSYKDEVDGQYCIYCWTNVDAVKFFIKSLEDLTEADKEQETVQMKVIKDK